MKNGRIGLDETDIKILNHLQKDAKLTARTLGERIALSQTPVYERIKKLERSGVIQKYVTLLDSDVVGKNVVVFINLSLQEHHIQSQELLINHLKSLPQISELYQVSGQFDYMVKVRVSSVGEFQEFIAEKILCIENIKTVVSHIVLEEMKYSTAISLD